MKPASQTDFLQKTAAFLARAVLPVLLAFSLGFTNAAMAASPHHGATSATMVMSSSADTDHSTGHSVNGVMVCQEMAPCTAVLAISTREAPVGTRFEPARIMAAETLRTRVEQPPYHPPIA